jgi:hypothetical protein
LNPSLAFSRIGNCRKLVFFQGKLEQLPDLFDLEISFYYMTWADWHPRVEFSSGNGASLVAEISRCNGVCWFVAEESRRLEISRSLSGNFQVFTFDELLRGRNFHAEVVVFDDYPKFSATLIFDSKEISRFFTLYRLACGRVPVSDDARRNFQVALLSCVSSSRVVFSRDCAAEAFLPPWVQPYRPDLEIVTANVEMEISSIPPKPKRKRGPARTKILEIYCSDLLEDAPMSPRFPRFRDAEISRSREDLIRSIPRPFASRLRLCRAK